MLSTDLTVRLIFFAALIAAVILHEISHGVVALWFGDDTAKRAGRITLNPIPHIDPVGSILLPAIGAFTGLPVIGWAKPVPINPAKLRKPREQMLFVGLAGPLTNFGLMTIAAVLARIMYTGDLYTFGTVGPWPLVAFEAFAFVNLFLGIFNLLPIPPLDGSSLIERLLPEKHLPTWWQFRQYGLPILFVLVFLFPSVLAGIVEPFADALNNFIIG